MARAVVHDPPGADLRRGHAGPGRAGRPRLLQTVAELRDQGKCIVFSTHIMREAEKLCDRMAIMYRGRILAEGTLAEVRERYGRAGPRGIVFQLISRHDEAAAAATTP